MTLLKNIINLVYLSVGLEIRFLIQIFFLSSHTEQRNTVLLKELIQDSIANEKKETQRIHISSLK